MAVTYEQLRAEAATIAPWFIPVISTTTSAGGAQTLIDAYLFQNPGANYLTTKSAAGMWALLPDAVAVADRERRLSGSSPVTLASGTLTHDGLAYTNNPGSGVQYELCSIQPRIAHRLLVVTMDNFLQADYFPLHAGNDEDMEATGTSSYAVSGAGSVTKVTTAGNVESGLNALFFNAGTAGEYVEGPTYRVRPNQSYNAGVMMRVDLGGPAYFVIWNKTADTEIDAGGRKSHSLETYEAVQRSFTAPAGCEEVSLRVYVTGATDDVYIDHFISPYSSGDETFMLPSFITREADVRRLYTARYGRSYSAGVYDASSRGYRPIRAGTWNTRFTPHHANPGRLEFPHGFGGDGEIWVEALRKAGEITAFVFTAAGETAPTTNLNKRLIALSWVKRVCVHVLNYRPDDLEVKATLVTVDEELKPLMDEYGKDLETDAYEDRNPMYGRSLTGV